MNQEHKDNFNADDEDGQLWEDLAEGLFPPIRNFVCNSVSGENVIKVHLNVVNEFFLHDWERLSDRDLTYAKWLRIVVLRTLIKTQILGVLKGRMSYSLSQVCDFLGFENFEEFVKSRTIAEIRQDLGVILTVWEGEVGFGPVFPKNLSQNLSKLAEVIAINDDEVVVLGFSVLLHTEAALESCCDLFGGEPFGYSIERIIAPMLGLDQKLVANVVSQNGNLSSTGLLNINISGRNELRQIISFLTPTFAAKMMCQLSDIREVIDEYVKPSPPPTLARDDFQYVDKNIKVCEAFLRKAICGKKKGVNILIYGRPGTGKTEFARFLSNALGYPLFDVCSNNGRGDPVAPSLRMRSYRVAQSLLENTPSILLFDECEEVLIVNHGFERVGGEVATPRKSWINKLLESNSVPTVWLANDIHDFDEAYLRRFSLCFEMPMPNMHQRERIVRKIAGDTCGIEVLERVLRVNEISPAELVEVFSTVGILSEDLLGGNEELAIHLMNNRLSLKKSAKIPLAPKRKTLGFNLSLLNASVDLDVLVSSVARSRMARICLWGPSGTGKTEFGKWMASFLKVPHLIMKASDLLSPFVGETEQKMAKAFELAEKQGAVLQFDEVDSFLRDRRSAGRTWESTQVNEMLTQMEAFSGIFIASTNLFENLDPASLRRFDMVIKFDYSKADAVWSMFLEVAGLLGLSQPETALWRDRVTGILNLTPGDFDQLIREAVLVPVGDVDTLYQRLIKNVEAKESGAVRPVGFLR